MTMSRRRMQGLAAAGALVAAASAGAAEVCSVVDVYARASVDGFQSIRGRKDEFGDYRATTNLPNANKCKISDAGDGHYEASCDYLFLDESDKAAGYRQMKSTLERCLGWPAGSLFRTQPYKNVRLLRVTIMSLGKYDLRVEMEHVPD